MDTNVTKVTVATLLERISTVDPAIAATLSFILDEIDGIKSKQEWLEMRIELLEREGEQCQNKTKNISEVFPSYLTTKDFITLDNS